MKATILPLKGKYYGTKIKVTDLAGHSRYADSDTILAVWVYSGEPSVRQREEWGDDADDSDMMCDNHFESALSYDIALRIAAALTDEVAR